MAAKRAALDGVEKAIGYEFADRGLLRQALTHRSHSSKSGGLPVNYERLEFLGDAVLGLIAGEQLLKKFPSHDEGGLTKLKAYFVSARYLGKVAKRLRLGQWLRLGRGEETGGGREKIGLLVDCLEALIGAIYLDGGLPPAKEFVEREILTAKAFRAADENVDAANAKSTLQERLHARKMPSPEYHVVAKAGPPHSRTFTVEVRVGDQFRASAKARSIKGAEQHAAALALRWMEQRTRKTAPAGETGARQQA